MLVPSNEHRGLSRLPFAQFMYHRHIFLKSLPPIRTQLELAWKLTNLCKIG